MDSYDKLFTGCWRSEHKVEAGLGQSSTAWVFVHSHEGVLMIDRD
jgi:hypothetical protein